MLNQKFTHIMGFIIFFLWSFSVFAEDMKNLNVYRVLPGDVLEISVWKEEHMQKEVLVRPDGGISFPLAGDFIAQGKSLAQVHDEIVKRLSQYIPDPIVTVSAKQLLGNVIYVIGKVNEPGAFVISSNIDVMQALSLAKGMTPFSAVNDIKILRRDTSGKQRAVSFSYSDVEDGDDLEQNIMLQSGDVVVVP
ncbi:MAG: polysaccharide biosynthesis/export family protein [Gammaproteobacteria bacterium]|nr:polysaccharide biosynthesis/export family protein [Gammaproteobacteria bacterium]